MHLQLIEMLQVSTAPLLHTLFGASSNTATATTAASASVAQQFKHQLDELLRAIATTTPYFIRCIKPNALASCDKAAFDRELVMRQLQNSGVMDAIRIRAHGFPGENRRGSAHAVSVAGTSVHVHYDACHVSCLLPCYAQNASCNTISTPPTRV